MHCTFSIHTYVHCSTLSCNHYIIKLLVTIQHKFTKSGKMRCYFLFKSFYSVLYTLSATTVHNGHNVLFVNVFRVVSVTCLHVLCTGDGGNDVSMIQAANVGIGIVGKVCVCMYEMSLRYVHVCMYEMSLRYVHVCMYEMSLRYVHVCMYEMSLRYVHVCMYEMSLRCMCTCMRCSCYFVIIYSLCTLNMYVHTYVRMRIQVLCVL